MDALLNRRDRIIMAACLRRGDVEFFSALRGARVLSYAVVTKVTTE